jgi:toxin ParE1/3/4
MASRVVWSEHALRDIDAIAEYIARDSEAYAQSIVQKLLASGRALQQFPFSGRVVPEASDTTIREVFVFSFRVIYRVRADAVTVIAVIHGRRLLSPAELPPDAYESF